MTHHITYFASMDAMALLLTEGVPSEADHRALTPDAYLRYGTHVYALHVVWDEAEPSSYVERAAIVLAKHRLEQTLA